jgi:hypothetical protein
MDETLSRLKKENQKQDFFFKDIDHQKYVFITRFDRNLKNKVSRKISFRRSLIIFVPKVKELKLEVV